MDQRDGDVLIVLTTVGSSEEATSIARALVEKKIAACVNVVPGLRSIYRWEGEICDDAELLLVTKTTRARFAELTATIHDLHSYDVPEIVALRADAVDEPYLAWLRAAVAN